MRHEFHIPVSVGEVIDKITILEIKQGRITDPAKLANIHTEFEALQSALQSLNWHLPDLSDLKAELLQINTALWEIEDDIRECERQKNFDLHFVALARSVYRSNDERSCIKRKINELSGSAIVEEKSYKAY